MKYPKLFKRGSYVLYGKIYKTIIFHDVKEANDFMEKNKEWGVLAVWKNTFKKEVIHLARNDDEGIRVGAYNRKNG